MSTIKAGETNAAELKTLTSLAWPVVVGMLGAQMMGVVDMMMVGRLGEEAIAAVGMGFLWAIPFVMFVRGCIRGLDPIVSQAHGAGETDAIGKALARAVVITLALCGPTMAWHLGAERGLRLLGQPVELLPMASDYVWAIMWGVPGMLLFFMQRAFLQAMGIMRPAAMVMLGCNLFNVPLNWVLMYGAFGFEGMGVVGCGWSTAICQFILAGWLFWTCRRELRDAWPGWQGAFDWRATWQQFSLGVPISLQVCLEVWAFNVTVLIVGWLGTQAMAAHMVALNLAAAAFMVPLGISAAATTRVGNLLGAEQPWGPAAWLSVGLGAGVMCISGAVFFFFPESLVRLYTDDPEVVALAATLLPVAAFFQVADGVQAVAGGVLRGLADVRVPAAILLVSYWVIGLPLGAWWAVDKEMGPHGVWWGLVLALAITAFSFCIRLGVLQGRGVERV